MTPLIETDFEDFIEKQRQRVVAEIVNWHEFKENNPEGVYLAFSEQHREGRVHTQGNELPPDRSDAVRDYLELPHVAEIDGVLVDLLSVQIPYNCMWKSCRETGKYCCKVTSCTANTDDSMAIMREAGREFIDKYTVEKRKSAIRKGDTHTDTLKHNRIIDGHCVFGEEYWEENPSTGEEQPHIHCNLHEAAYDHDVPMHWFHSIGPSLFPADILIVDGQWFLTAASERAKEDKITRWFVTSDETICTNIGDTKPYGILQHPDFDAIFRDVLGDNTMNEIQREAYGAPGPVEPDLDEGWIRDDIRDIEPYTEECRECEGDGCDYCDGRGYFRNWKKA